MRSWCSSVLRPSQPSRFGRNFGNTCRAPHSAPLRIQNQNRIQHPESRKMQKRNSQQCALYYIDKQPARGAARWPCPPCCSQPALGPPPRPTRSHAPSPMRARPHAGCGMHMHTASPQSPPPAKPVPSPTPIPCTTPYAPNCCCAITTGLGRIQAGNKYSTRQRSQ